MLKSIEDINATKKRLRIEIPSDVIEREIGGSLEKLRHRLKYLVLDLGRHRLI